MADDPTATGTATGTTAQAADGSAGGSAIKDKPIEEQLAAEKAAREEAERKNAQLLSEKSAVEAERRRLDEERARMQQASTAPPAGADAADPFLNQIARLDAAYQEYPNDPAYQGLRLSLLTQRELALREVGRTNFENELLKIPAADREATRAKYSQGGFQSLAQAHQQVKQESDQRGSIEAERAKLAEERKQLELDREANRRQAVSVGGRPDFGGSQRTDLMEFEDYRAKVDAAENRGDRTEVSRLLHLQKTGGVKPA